MKGHLNFVKNECTSIVNISHLGFGDRYNGGVSIIHLQNDVQNLTKLQFNFFGSFEYGTNETDHFVHLHEMQLPRGKCDKNVGIVKLKSTIPAGFYTQ